MGKLGRCDLWDDTFPKLLVDLSIPCFTATPIPGLARQGSVQKIGLKIDRSEQFGYFIVVQRTTSPGAQIPQPDRSDRRPDEALDGMINRREQSTNDVVAAFMQDYLDHHPGT